MNKDKKIYFKKLLLEERKELLSQIKRKSDEEKLSLKDSTGELSSYDNHPADQGSNTYEREKDLGLKDNALIILEKVNTALELLDGDNYGICQKCGREIAEERLEAVPYTWFCKDCGEIEEEVLNSSFANYGFGVEDERENAWEDVAQYGTSNTSQDE